MERISEVERLFGFPSNKLVTTNRVLVGEGVLTKICRRKPKLRHFFLFNDVLIYGRIVVNRKVLRNPQFIDLADVSVKNVLDNGIYRNGFSILSPRKSFTVYASTSEEKAQWVVHLKKCISNSIHSTKQSDSIKKSPIWIPDSEASHCMVCGTTEFNLVHRRHHCRHCGKVVCDKCSAYRWILPYQSSSRVRVCSICHRNLLIEKNSASSHLNDDCQHHHHQGDEEDEGEEEERVQYSQYHYNHQRFEKLSDEKYSPITTNTTITTINTTTTTTTAAVNTKIISSVNETPKNGIVLTPTFLGNVNMSNDELNTESDTESDTND
ncbi:unnamed protein product [Trichobilharzia szidati]|nr:unnamed protein product [Trichobilharzia szidati]